MLDKLLEGHARLRELAQEIRGIVLGPVPSDGTELARQRWRLTREIFQHLDLEDQLAFIGLLRDPRPDAVRTAAEFKVGLQPIYQDYQHHMRRWQGYVEGRDWAEYRKATLTLLERLHQRMHDEETRLYPYLRDRQATFEPLAHTG